MTVEERRPTLRVHSSAARSPGDRANVTATVRILVSIGVGKDSMTVYNETHQSGSELGGNVAVDRPQASHVVDELLFGEECLSSVQDALFSLSIRVRPRPCQLTSTSAFQAVAHSAASSAVAARSNRFPSSQNAVNEEGRIICSTCDWQRERTRFSSKERQSCIKAKLRQRSFVRTGSRVVGRTTRAEMPITATPPRLLLPCTMSSKQYRKLCRGCWANKSNSSTTMTSGWDVRVAGGGASVEVEVEVEASVLAVDAEEGSSKRRRVDIVAELLDCRYRKRRAVSISEEGWTALQKRQNAHNLPRPPLRPWHRSRTLARRVGPQSLASPGDPSCAPTRTSGPRQSYPRRARAKVA